MPQVGFDRLPIASQYGNAGRPRPFVLKRSYSGVYLRVSLLSSGRGLRQVRVGELIDDLPTKRPRDPLQWDEGTVPIITIRAIDDPCLSEQTFDVGIAVGSEQDSVRIILVLVKSKRKVVEQNANRHKWNMIERRSRRHGTCGYTLRVRSIRRP